MRRNVYPKFICNSYVDVQEATNKLDKATMIDLQFDDGGVVKDIKRFRGVYNISKGEECAAVAPYYNLIRHKEYIDGFAQALDRINIKYSMKIESMGNRVYADINFENRNLKFDKLNEEFTTGIRLANSYNKTSGVVVAPLYTRLACTNGMVLTRAEKAFSVKHNDKRLLEIQGFIEKQLNGIISSSQELQMWVSRSMHDSIEWKLAIRILEKMFLQYNHREQILERLGIAMIKKKEKELKYVDYVWNNENEKKDKFTRWEIYNAITHYVSHGEHMTPFINDYFQKKAERILITPLEKLPMVEARVI